MPNTPAHTTTQLLTPDTSCDTLSPHAIHTAFLAFFEKQSFLSSYLCTGSGTQIIIATNNTLKAHHRQLLQFVGDVHYYDISLHPSLHVILAVTKDAHPTHISLTSHTRLDHALLHAQQHLLQQLHPTEPIHWAITDEDFYLAHFLKQCASHIGTPSGYLSTAPIHKNSRYWLAQPFHLGKLLKALKAHHHMVPYITYPTTWHATPASHRVIVSDPHWFPYPLPTPHAPAPTTHTKHTLHTLFDLFPHYLYTKVSSYR